MKDFQRIAVADRSSLAHNLYRMLLSPIGFHLLPHQTLHDLKKTLADKPIYDVCIINSNIFGNHFDYHWEWLEQNPALKAMPKIFLCDPGEKKLQTRLKELPRSHLLVKPFSPDTLETLLKKLIRKKK